MTSEIASLELPDLLLRAAALRDAGHGELVSYSRKVFIPLTQLCRDVCHYCTFAKAPRNLAAAYLTPEQVLQIARAGERAGCHEALFTLGDKPELRYAVARDALARLGYKSTLDYLTAMCELVARETSLLPHANPGVMSRDEIAGLRQVCVSQGLMLESLSARLCAPGQVHHGSPDKDPAVRMETIRQAGELAVPFTTGILIGIGETRQERLDSLLALKQLHDRYGHVQEIIVQNFRAKPHTRLAGAVEPGLEELLWTLAAARLVFGAQMNIQAPPNLTPGEYPLLIRAGINDWGGISPVTPDHVNPEAAWPQIGALRSHTQAEGKTLVERLAVYPAYALRSDQWQASAMATRVLRAMDTDGYARTDDWAPGRAGAAPRLASGPTRPAVSSGLTRVLARAQAGGRLEEGEIESLFHARGAQFDRVRRAADELRREVSGDVVRYVVNRNINYTNVCAFRCHFCAFSKGRSARALRGSPYDLELEEVARRASEAWSRGATEVCMQGGIHPDYTGDTYLALLRAVKDAVPQMHVHAFSPLEIAHGAATLGIAEIEFLRRLRSAGLGSLPGTAAEILVDEVRALICPDKLSTDQWLRIVESAHEVGLRTTATIMFGHVENASHWARHLLRIRSLQERTGGITEFVPLPFVHMEAPMFHAGRARRGPTYREALLMHAVARLALHPLIPNIQVSWVKLGADGVRACLDAGANDLGGTLMNESISRAAGTEHGQEMPPESMDALIRSIGRVPEQRTTLYAAPEVQRTRASYGAPAMAALTFTPARKLSNARR